MIPSKAADRAAQALHKAEAAAPDNAETSAALLSVADGWRYLAEALHDKSSLISHNTPNDAA